MLAAAAVSVLCRFVIQTDGLIPVILTLGVLTFFRALGNPLEQDTQMDHFLLIPESTWHKLFWSLMGGTANCFLDLLPDIAIMAVGLVFGQTVLAAVGCAVVNILLGLVFFFLTPLFLEPILPWLLGLCAGTDRTCRDWTCCPSGQK